MEGQNDGKDVASERPAGKEVRWSSWNCLQSELEPHETVHLELLDPG